MVSIPLMVVTCTCFPINMYHYRYQERTPNSPIVSWSRLRRAMIGPWSSGDTSATRGSWYPDIAADETHLRAPIQLVELEGGRCQAFDYNTGEFVGICCSCCRWSVALSLVGIIAVMFFTPACSIYITVTPRMGSPIFGPTVSKNRIIEFQASSGWGGSRPVSVPRRENAWLFPTICGESDTVYLSVQ